MALFSTNVDHKPDAARHLQAVFWQVESDEHKIRIISFRSEIAVFEVAADLRVETYNTEIFRIQNRVKIFVANKKKTYWP